MHSRQFLTGFACLLSITSALAQATTGTGAPFRGQGVADAVSQSTETQNPSSSLSTTAQNDVPTGAPATQAMGSQGCVSPFEIPLGNNGRFIPVVINGRALNLAISLIETETYLFAEGLCDTVLQRKDSCLGGNPPDSTTATKAAAFKPVPDKYEYQFTFMEQNVDMTFQGEGEGRGLTVEEMKINRVISIGNVEVGFRDRYAAADGVIGLGTGSKLLQQIAKQSRDCKMRAGFGLHLAPNGSIVFGGLDIGGSSIETPSENILESISEYRDSKIQVFSAENNGNPSDEMNITVVFDAAAPENEIPSSVNAILNKAIIPSPDSNVAITIGGSVFILSVNLLLPQNQSIGDADFTNNQNAQASPGEKLILGAAFFPFVYVAQIPGEESLILTPDNNDIADKDIKSFSEIPAYRDRDPVDDGDDDDDDKDDTTNDLSEDLKGESGDEGPEDSEEHQKSNTNLGPIIGGAVGGVVVLALIIVGGCFLYRRRKLSRGQSFRNIEKEHEAVFDSEIGHDVGILPHFTKESGYATIPTPPPPPSSQTFVEPGYLHASTEYLPPLRPYSDDSPMRSHNSSPAPLVSTITYQARPQPTERSRLSNDNDYDDDDHHHDLQDRRVSLAPTISTATDLPSPMISRNVSTVSRRDYPTISQIQTRSVLPEHNEDDDDDDAVSIRSGPGYQYRGSAPAAPPRLPFARQDNERSDSPL